MRLDEQNSERFYEAEIYRLLGEAHLRSHQDLDQAERYFSKGLKVAREQKAKSLELKLCVSIYDLYELRQNADKYRSQLGEIYGSFSEGFDTADLVSAKARLQMLDRPQDRQDTGPHFSHHAAWPRRRGDRMSGASSSRCSAARQRARWRREPQQPAMPVIGYLSSEASERGGGRFLTGKHSKAHRAFFQILHSVIAGACRACHSSASAHLCAFRITPPEPRPPMVSSRAGEPFVKVAVLFLRPRQFHKTSAPGLGVPLKRHNILS